jgi:phage terminase small subunit
MAAMTRLMQRFCAAKLRLGDRRGSGVEAARAAGYQGAESSLKVTASRLMKDPRVRAELARLRNEAKTLPAASLKRREKPRAIKVAVLNLARKLHLLAKLAEDQTAKDSDRIRAIELASKLDGDLGSGRGGLDVEAVAAAAANASATAQVVVWVGNSRGPAPEADEVVSG